MSDFLHEKLWDVTLIVLQIVGFFLAGRVGIGYCQSIKPGSRIHVLTRNIFVAYVKVKRLQGLGFMAEWEPAK